MLIQTIQKNTYSFSPKWIQNGTTVRSCTSNRIVHDWRKIWSLFERRVQATKWDNHACCLQPTWRPHIPAESNTISVLILLYKLLICRHAVSSLHCPPGNIKIPVNEHPYIILNRYGISKLMGALWGPPSALDLDLYWPEQLCCVQLQNLELTTHCSLITLN